MVFQVGHTEILKPGTLLSGKQQTLLKFPDWKSDPNGLTNSLQVVILDSSDFNLGVWIVSLLVHLINAEVGGRDAHPLLVLPWPRTLRGLLP